MHKILIINQPGYNRGDEAAHRALVRSLLDRIPDVEIHVLSPPKFRESIRQIRVIDTRVRYLFDPPLWPLTSFLIDQWRKSGKCTWLWRFHPYFKKYRDIYQWADLVVCAPGGICMGGYQNWDHLFHLELARVFNLKLAYYGRSFGPFPTETEANRQFKKTSIQLLNYFSFLSVRDSKTELLAKELGLSYVPTVDTAFLDSPKAELPYELKMRIGKNPYFVFVPNYLLWHYAFKDRISHGTILDFYSKVIDEITAAYPECDIVMLPQLFGEWTYAFSDVEFFRDLAAIKNNPRLIVIPDCYSSDVQQNVIKGATALLGARYHSIVFAINQSVPFVALSYEHKISGMLDSLGKAYSYVDIRHSFDSSENTDATLLEIRKRLSGIQLDTNVLPKAKAIANNCMNLFIKQLSSLS